MRNRALLAVAALTAAVVSVAAQSGSHADFMSVLPAEHPAIDYWNAEPTDAVARLQEQVLSGEVKLAFDERFGYLPATLEALGVPESSQMLVFSKTSFQATRIFPRAPRALYHNDTVSVGWVDGGDVVEVASMDPKLGVVFYTLPQVEVPRPRFALRTTECIACHVGGYTEGVPGLLIRSVHPDQTGAPLRTPSYITDHRSPLEERWGGWYVSGTHGSMKHLGNATYLPNHQPYALVGSETLNVTRLAPYISRQKYLRETSDIVSLMLMEHQTRMTNLITRLGYLTRIALADGMTPEAEAGIDKTVEDLVRYALFVDEAPLESPIAGESELVAEFEARGPRDDKGRSLHQLDLETRLLQHPCSYLIQSEAMRALPDPAKKKAYRRLWEVLTGRDESGVYAGLEEADRTAIHEILAATEPGLPEYW